MPRNYLNTTSRSGGRARSTRAQFEEDVENRLYGGNTRKGNLPRVAQAAERNVPRRIVDEANRLGGRNSLRMSPNGTMTEHEARYKEIRAALGLSEG